MDRFSEQIVARVTDKKTLLLKILIGAGLLIVLAVLSFFLYATQFSFAPFCLAAGAGALWLAVWLAKGLNVEYEYIVTNDDFDVDKIMGQRKRKRLISIDLKAIDEFAPYVDNTELHSDVTVLADDGTGYDMWYLFADTESNGKIAIIFNPDERTRRNIVAGLSSPVRLKTDAKLSENEEAEEAVTEE